jgi:hypothetical protein|tara:strand:- start:342 stop:665 length:324 start_codon:yes stop_codon:yes gene_type:complete
MSKRIEYVARYGYSEDGANVDPCKNKRHADKLIQDALRQIEIDPTVESTPHGFLLSIWRLHIESGIDEFYWENPLLDYNEDGESVIMYNGKELGLIEEDGDYVDSDQ